MDTRASHWVLAALCFSFELFVTACASQTRPREAGVSGTATYRERMALPPGAAFEAMRGMYSYMADTGWFVDCATGSRLPLAQEGDNAALEAAYSKARSTAGEELLATVDGRIETREPMEGPAKPTLIVARFVSVAKGSCAEATSTASLENTYWKLIRIGSTPVTVGAGQREPHFVLQAAEMRVTGFSGCNRLMGSYTIDGDRLTFSQMGGTMMACVSGMELEKALHDALAKVATWRIAGEQLELFDAAGESLAQFESRYL